MSSSHSSNAPCFLLTAALLLWPAPGSSQGTSVLTLLPTEGRRLEIGGEFTGALSTSDYLSANDDLLEAWEMEGRAGESVTVDLEAEAFDPRLYVVGPGLAETLSDDDGGGGCNARLTFTFLENGTFRVVASSSGSRQTGTYRIRTSERAGPAPSFGCGEVDPSSLASLPTEGRTLRLGSAANSILGSGSPTVQDGRPAEAWQLEGGAGDRVSIVMTSDAFDAYLYLSGTGLDGVQTDDDGAGGLNAQIELTLPADGPYTVVAAALSPGASGSYEIRVEEPIDLNTLPTDGRTIDLGQTVQGRLGFDDVALIEGRQGQVWAFSGVAGQAVTIDLSSEDFDSYLYLVGPGLDEPMSDDDGGDGLDSRLTVTLPESGTYRILVTAVADAAGEFSLSTSPQ